MTNEADTFLKAVRSVLETAVEPYLCEVCWAFAATGREHACDPEARAMALARVVSPVLMEPHKRAKGYGVR